MRLAPLFRSKKLRQAFLVFTLIVAICVPLSPTPAVALDGCVDTRVVLSGQPTTLNGASVTGTVPIATGDQIIVSDVALYGSMTLDAVIDVVDVQSAIANYKTSGGVEIRDSPVNNPYMQIDITIVEGGTMTPVQLSEFEVRLDDIDSQLDKFYTDVMGVLGPSSTALGSDLEIGGFTNGQLGQYTYARVDPTTAGSALDWEAEIGVTGNPDSHAVTHHFGTTDSLDIVWGATGQRAKPATRGAGLNGMDFAGCPITIDDFDLNNTAGQSVTVDVLGNDDVAGSPPMPVDASINLDSASVGGTLNSDGSVTVPGQGTWVVDSANGTITFTPETGFIDDPTPIDYTITDAAGLESAPATVTIGYNPAIQGAVQADTTGDGLGDTPLAGVTVELVDASGNVVATAVTDADGNYSFSDVAPGDYTIEQTDLAGYGSVSDVDGGTDNTIAVTMADESLTGQDFVDEPRASISGVVEADTTGDGVADTPLAGVTVELVDAAGNVVATAATNADGSYSFADVPPGDYTIVQTDLVGYGSVSDVDGGTDNTIAVTTMGADVVDQDFVDEPLSTVSGTVEADVDGDGVADTPLAGVTVELVDVAGNVVATAVTDADGNYTFADVTPGGYTIVQTDLAGYESVTDADGGVDSTIAVAVAGGVDVVDQDFLDGPVGAISGTVEADTTGDGVADTPLSGVTVELVDAAGNVVATAVTDVAGDYLFADVLPGEYTIVQTDLAGYASVTDFDGGTDSTIAVTMADGVDVVDQDFVDEPVSAVSGTVEADTTGDGVADTPLAGVTVELVDVAGNVVATAVTDADGNYSFADVPPGGYTIVQTDLAGYESVTDADGGVDSTIAVAVAGGVDVVDQDFVDEPLSGISGVVEADSTGDGLGDTPLAGVTVELVDAAGNVVATAVTSANGSYAFADVAPGDYTIVQTDLAGYDSVTDVDGGTDNTIAVTVADGVSIVDQDFVDEPLASISGTVEADTTGDGVADTPLAGVTVELVDAAGNVVATAVTDADGSYSFAEVPPGDYTIEQTDLAGYRSVTDADGGTDNVIAVTMTGSDVIDQDFVDEPLSTVSGTVEADTTGDGVADTPLSGVTVELVDAAGNVVATAVTDADGNYTFADVPPGDYTIVQTDLAGYDSVTDVDGGTDNIIAVAVADGVDVVDQDFVDEPLSNVSGTVEVDVDGNGVADMPLAGVTVELVDAAGNVVATAVTDVDGSYTFADVPPGDYTIVQIDLAGYGSVTDVDGGTDNIIAVAVADGVDVVDQDFVDESLSTVSGTVEADTTGDGVADTPLPGVTVELVDAAGNVVATAVTDADGSYTFADVPPGDYTIVETDLAGYGSVTDVDGGTDNIIAVAVADGVDVVDQDFVDESLSGISGAVAADTTGDGVADTPLAGVTVELVDAAGNVVATATTDVDGNYSFTDVPPGDYTIVQTDLAGYDSVTDVDGGTDNTIAVTVTSADLIAQDFVDEPLAAIFGTVEADTVGDGVADTPLAGVTVDLVDDTGTVIVTAVTGADGNYSFAELPPGDYTIVQTDLAGYDSVIDADGGVDNAIAVSLTGADVADQDFLDEPLANISGEVVQDIDGDGAPDAPLQGVTVELIDAEGNVVAVAVTDENGFFDFSNVPPGDYTLVETDPDQYESISDSDGANDNTISVTVAAGTDTVDLQFVDDAPVLLDDSDLDNTVGDTVVLSILDNDDPLVTAGSVSLLDPVTGEQVNEITVPGEGVWTLSAEGTVTFQPEDGFEGNPTPIQYTAENPDGLDPTATIVVSYLPVANDDEDLNNELGTEVAVSPLANDVGELDPASLMLIDPSTGEAVTVLAVDGEGIWTVDPSTGEITFTPEDGFEADPTPVTYQVSTFAHGGSCGPSRTALRLGAGLAGPSSECPVEPVQVEAMITVTYQKKATPDESLDNVQGTPVIVNPTQNDQGDLIPQSVGLIDPVTGESVDSVVVVGEGVWSVNPETGEITFTPEQGFDGNPTLIQYQVETVDGDVLVESITITYLPRDLILAFTGAGTPTLVFLSLFLMAMGAVLLAGGRRRTTN